MLGVNESFLDGHRIIRARPHFLDRLWNGLTAKAHQPLIENHGGDSSAFVLHTCDEDLDRGRAAVDEEFDAVDKTRIV
jgi:hypothetical protein